MNQFVSSNSQAMKQYRNLGMKTAVEAEVTADRLECITRAENAHRNHPRNRDPELGRLVQLKGAITRQVNRIAREAQEQAS